MVCRLYSTALFFGHQNIVPLIFNRPHHMQASFERNIGSAGLYNIIACVKKSFRGRGGCIIYLLLSRAKCPDARSFFHIFWSCLIFAEKSCMPLHIGMCFTVQILYTTNILSRAAPSFYMCLQYVIKLQSGRWHRMALLLKV